MLTRNACLAIVLLILDCLAFAADKPLSLKVAAGKLDRPQTVASFPLPEWVTAGSWQLRDTDGQSIPLQVIGSRGYFVVRNLKAGQTRSYTLDRAADIVPAVSIERHGGELRTLVGGRHAFTYQFEKVPAPAGFGKEFDRGGYIHPVYTPAGVLVTDDYPPKHKHHHGIFAPWTKTRFEDRTPDFWNMGQKTGTVEPAALGRIFSGPVVGGFQTSHRFVDLSARPDPKVALNETWDVLVYGPVGSEDKLSFIFDIVSTQTCATDQPLILPRYHYGGMAIRGHRVWDAAPNATFLTSEGRTRADANESRARWCHVGGQVNGKTAGIAMLSHPANFRFPQPLRVHPTEPYFCFIPSLLGDWSIEPGRPYVAQYRFVISDGPADRQMLDALWADYAQPVEVTVN